MSRSDRKPTGDYTNHARWLADSDADLLHETVAEFLWAANYSRI
ncbi:MAG: hypothetical protein ABEJ82_03345 [Haloplanus sp.]